MKLRTMVPGDFSKVAELIYHSTNAWYEARLGHRVFQGKAEDCLVFCEVYETLDPGCGLVVEEPGGEIIGSCFFHPRETHSSLGIMNVHPDSFGKGVAGRLLRRIVEMAEERQLPLRLVSSALNLDSFSLYNRAGFVPVAVYQDMLLEVPENGVVSESHPNIVRKAVLTDVDAMARLEMEVAGIRRETDYRLFVENRDGFWDARVSLDESGAMNGFLVSSDHPASRMIGPGVSRDSEGMATLLVAQMDRFRGRKVLFLLPVKETELVAKAYGWGAKNCELHFSQVRGAFQEPKGLIMPAFLPE